MFQGLKWVVACLYPFKFNLLVHAIWDVKFSFNFDKITTTILNTVNINSKSEFKSTNDWNSSENLTTPITSTYISIITTLGVLGQMANCAKDDFLKIKYDNPRSC